MNELFQALSCAYIEEEARVALDCASSRVTNSLILIFKDVH